MEENLSQERIDAILDWCGPRIRDRIHLEFDYTASILDVGSGWGKYRYLLSNYPNMDACEVWLPTILDNDLSSKYRSVFNKNICDFISESFYYDVVIMGDVLEHIPRSEAKELVSKLVNKCKQLYVVVPFEYKQGEEEGNPYQVHEQDDLTPDLMKIEYPDICLVDIEFREGKPFKGIYIKSGSV